MASLTSYLNLRLEGSREAMDFYRSCLGGEIIITAVKDTPAKDQMPASQHDKILNARLWVSKRGYFGIGLATAGPNAGSREYRLPLSHRRDIRSAEILIRKAFRGR